MAKVGENGQKQRLFANFAISRLLHLAKNPPKVAAYGGAHESHSGYAGEILV